MKVEFVEPDVGFQPILEDPAFDTLINEVLAEESVLQLAAQIIRNYLDLDALLGNAALRPSVEKFASTFAPKAKRREAQKVAQAFRELYAKHDPGHVRGAILEGLVERRLQFRYAGSTDELVNNHKVRCSSDGEPTYTTSYSIDVSGWDQSVGECHDCKAAARKFRPNFIRELERELVPRRFKIGLVTADSHHATLIAFKRKNVPEPRHAIIIPLEKLWTLAPLQA